MHIEIYKHPPKSALGYLLQRYMRIGLGRKNWRGEFSPAPKAGFIY